MKCSCLSVLLVYRPTADCVALLILTRTYQLANDVGLRARRGNACVRTCKTKTKIELKLKRQRKRNMILKTKKPWSLVDHPKKNL